MHDNLKSESFNKHRAGHSKSERKIGDTSLELRRSTQQLGPTNQETKNELVQSYINDNNKNATTGYKTQILSNFGRNSIPRNDKHQLGEEKSVVEDKISKFDNSNNKQCIVVDDNTISMNNSVFDTGKIFEKNSYPDQTRKNSISYNKCMSPGLDFDPDRVYTSPTKIRDDSNLIINEVPSVQKK